MGRIQIIAAIMVAIVANIGWLFLGDFDPLAIDYQVFRQSASDPAPMSYPPTARLWFEPLAMLPLWPGFLLWSLASALAFYLAARSLSDGRIASLSLMSVASFQCLLMGQTSMLLSAAILYAVHVSAFAGGVMLGVVASIKPQLLVMAPLVMIVRRDWRMLGGSIVGGLGALGVQLAVTGLQPWYDWIATLPEFKADLIRRHILDDTITPAGFAENLGLNPQPFLILGIIVAAIAVFRLARRVEGIQLVALMVGSAILASPYALTHDTVALMPACVVFLLRRPDFRAIPIMALFAGVLVPFAMAAIAIWSAIFRRTGGRSGPERPGAELPASP